MLSPYRFSLEDLASLNKSQMRSRAKSVITVSKAY